VPTKKKKTFRSIRPPDQGEERFPTDSGKGLRWREESFLSEPQDLRKATGKLDRENEEQGYV